MARDSTIHKVHTSVLFLVSELGYRELTMEGIAARAGVSKQTLYRIWSSTSGILFEALLARSSAEGAVAVPNSGNLRSDLITLVDSTIADLTDPPNEALYRAVVAEIQIDRDLASGLFDRLLGPQLRAVQARLTQDGIDDGGDVLDALYGPIFYRWVLRTGELSEVWAHDHVERILDRIGCSEPR